MRIGGVDPRSLPTEEILVLPRGDDHIVFRATGISSVEDFNRLCPEPVPPKKLTKDGVVADTDDKDYQTASVGHRRLWTAYMVLQSLRPSAIEWDTVQLDNPATWSQWESDLQNAGLTKMEVSRVLALVMEANCLDEAKLEKARSLFLRTPGKPSGE